MVYRLEVSRLVPSDCGGMLYGYIDGEELHKLKSYKWLKEKYPDKINDEIRWDYDFNPMIIMDANEYCEFIKLYIKDYNEHYKSNSQTIDDFTDSLAADFVLVEWF